MILPILDEDNEDDDHFDDGNEDGDHIDKFKLSMAALACDDDDDEDDIKPFLLMQPAAYILRTTFRHCLSKYLREKVPINLMLFLLRLSKEIVEVLK